jgi:hypothetical protein
VGAQSQTLWEETGGEPRGRECVGQTDWAP